jgi:hypothetical protein
MVPLLLAFAAPAWRSSPHCGYPERRRFRVQGYFPAYRCRACQGYYTLPMGTVFAKTRQRPASLVLLLRGIAQGQPTACLARELDVSRQQLHTLRRRVQARINETAPTAVMTGAAFEADELYQNAGEGEQRFWVCDHAATRTCAALIAETIPAGSMWLYTDEWQSYWGAIRPMLSSATACTSGRGMMMEMADVRCTATPVKGTGAALQTYLRAFRVVHKRYLHLNVATYEAMVNTKRVHPS